MPTGPLRCPWPIAKKCCLMAQV
uniref:Uncharacterized protein n=1 Tax=Arundo donax TaxID=35708 RepID=A0A0A9FCL8_ARUDO